jgi:hypothetical protein
MRLVASFFPLAGTGQSQRMARRRSFRSAKDARRTPPTPSSGLGAFSGSFEASIGTSIHFGFFAAFGLIALAGFFAFGTFGLTGFFGFGVFGIFAIGRTPAVKGSRGLDPFADAVLGQLGDLGGEHSRPGGGR